MDYPYSFPPSPDQPDRLLTELHEAQVALTIAEYHIRSWRADPTPGHPPLSLSYLAHEALHEAGQLVDRIAEMLKIQACGTRATQQDRSGEIFTAVTPANADRGAPAGQPLAGCS